MKEIVGRTNDVYDSHLQYLGQREILTVRLHTVANDSLAIGYLAKGMPSRSRPKRCSSGSEIFKNK